MFDDFIRNLLPQKEDMTSKYRPECMYSNISSNQSHKTSPTQNIQDDNSIPRLKFFVNDGSKGCVLVDHCQERYNEQNDVEIISSLCKSLEGFKNKAPICKTFRQCQQWVSFFPCQIVVFQDIFFEIFEDLQKMKHACGFHVISNDNVLIARKARENKKIKSMYDHQDLILPNVKEAMQRLAITRQEKQAQRKNDQSGQEYRRMMIRNIIFPNFIRLSKYNKAQHNDYRLHLIGLRKLTHEDRLASKDKFIECSRQKFPNDSDLIQQYALNSFDTPKDILNFYTLDSFFYRVLNNTLRIAKNTEQFFSIGQPFNKVFEAIKQEYDKISTKIQDRAVYRGADLTASQCKYLEQNIGKFIEINGFVSTSKDIKKAKKFAENRKNNTIFKIILKKVPQKYKEFDYGYVDLEQNKYSAFEEDQILFNALNVFKIVSKQKDQNFDLFVLQYGAIFQILDKKPQERNQNETYAYYSFRELRQMNEQIKDIGEVFLRTCEPQKAIEIYEEKLVEMENSLKPVKIEEIEEVRIKAADAYLANGQPDRALQYYQSIFEKKSKKKSAIRRTSLNEVLETAKQQAQLITLSAKVVSIQNSMDEFQNAQKNFLTTQKQLEQIAIELKQQTEEEKIKAYMTVFWSQIDLKWQVYQGKKVQLLYQEGLQMLRQIQTDLKDVLDKTLINKKELLQQKKAKMKLSEIYESMAQTVEKLQSEKSNISTIKSSFEAVYSDLVKLVEDNSVQSSLLNLRRSEINLRSQATITETDILNYRQSVNLIASNTSQTDKIMAQVYRNLAELQSKVDKKVDNVQAKNTYKKQLIVETIRYGDNDPKPLNTRKNIADCERDDKNTIQALTQYSDAYNTNLFNTEKKYTLHAKILCNMSQAYSDKGDDGLAMKSLKKAYEILQTQLKGNDFKKSVLRFKIKLRIGRLYLSSSIRDKSSLVEAEKNLMEYHVFIKGFYKHKHSDVALSHNCLGALYSALKRYKQSKDQFVKSIDIYEDTNGADSLEVAKIKSNLAICYAQLKQFRKATKILLDSQKIFEKIYSNLRKCNPFEYESKYVEAQIQMLAGQYQKAIAKCQQSIDAQRFYHESRRNRSILPQMNSLLQMNRGNNSLRIESFRPQTNSLFVKRQSSNSPLQNSAFIQRNTSEPLNLNSVLNEKTDHEFKCEFKICECLMYLKKYKEAKNKLQKLRDLLNQRIKIENRNKLFENNVHSKKQMYLKKSQQFLKKANQGLYRRRKKYGTDDIQKD